MKKSLSLTLFLSLAFQTLSFPIPATLSAVTQPLEDQIGATSLNPFNAPLFSSRAKIIVEITAYSSTSSQTDSTPFITASGKRVRDGIVAANFLKLGTKIKIPELFGDKIFVVEDRMASRYFHRVDIWFPDRASALKFGKRENVEIVVL